MHSKKQQRKRRICINTILSTEYTAKSGTVGLCKFTVYSMSSSLSDIVESYNNILLLQLTPHLRRQVHEALNEAQEDLNKFEQISESERDECLQNARSRENAIAEKWNSLFSTLSNATFYFAYLHRFENFLVRAIEHEYAGKPLLEHQYVLSIARVKGAEAERRLAANMLAKGDIEAIDSIYEKILPFIVTELDISQSYLESRLAGLRSRRGSEKQHIFDLMRALRWEELATILIGDKCLTHFFRGSASRSDDVSTDDILAAVYKVHDKVFLSPMSNPDLSLTPWAKNVHKIRSTCYEKKSSNKNPEPEPEPEPELEHVDRDADNESLLPKTQEQSRGIVASFARNIRLRKLPSRQ